MAVPAVPGPASLISPTSRAWSGPPPSRRSGYRTTSDSGGPLGLPRGSEKLRQKDNTGQCGREQHPRPRWARFDTGQERPEMAPQVPTRDARGLFFGESNGRVLWYCAYMRSIYGARAGTHRSRMFGTAGTDYDLDIVVTGAKQTQVNVRGPGQSTRGTSTSTNSPSRQAETARYSDYNAILCGQRFSRRPVWLADSQSAPSDTELWWVARAASNACKRNCATSVSPVAIPSRLTAQSGGLNR